MSLWNINFDWSHFVYFTGACGNVYSQQSILVSCGFSLFIETQEKPTVTKNNLREF